LRDAIARRSVVDVMISIQNLGKHFGGRTLFEGVTLQLNAGSRYGLVGANGSGKTTMLKILVGDEPASDGSVGYPKRARLGVLRQDQFQNDDDTILNTAMMGDREVWDALQAQHDIVEHDGDPLLLADVEERLAALDGYTLAARAGAVLEGLGIEVAVHQQPLRTLSGGFKLRVLLAAVLLGRPDALLLDEPTNHLDILSIRWLEKFLAGYRGCAVVISHDQRFLDNIATHILDVDYETVTVYTGNFSRFLVEKEAQRSQKEAAIERQEKIIAHKRSFVERFGAKATKAKQAQSRLKQIEKIEVEELAATSRRAPQFRFVPERPSGRDVLDLKHISKSFGDKHVLNDVTMLIRRGEKVAIIGANGIGKSTLLKIAMGKLAADKGTSAWGHECRVGYFAQDHKDLLTDASQTPLSFLWDLCPLEGQAYVRGQLGRMLFSGDDVEKSVHALSGGEAARLVFSKIAVEKPNVLVLDEPTNHLDLESIHALKDALAAYEGTLVFVSHDRWFVSQLATRIIEITKTGVRDFPGTYAEYLTREGSDHLDADAVALKAKREKLDARDDDATTAVSWEEQKRRRNRGKDLVARRDKVTVQLERNEARKAEIQALYCSDGFYEKTSADTVAALHKEDETLSSTIDALMAEWESIETELATLV
jgi:ATPase subunit of ABC transporter with duplicated ATPase domains